MAKVVWLHISDIHILRPTETEDSEAANQEKVLTQFIKFMREKYPSSIIAKPQFLFITGDLAFSGKEDDYNSKDPNKYTVKKMIEEIAKEIRIDKSDYSNNFFLVPGNHDVNQNNLIDKNFNKEILDITQDLNSNNLDQLFLAQKGEFHERRIKAYKRFEDYCKFVCELKNIEYDEKLPYESILNYQQNIKIGNKDSKLYIIGINSAWLCHSLNKTQNSLSKSEDVNHLRLSEHLLSKLYENIPDDCIKVTLMHHDYNKFNDPKSDIKSLLERESHIILYGHEHKERFELSTPGGAQKIRAGHFYKKRWERNSVNFVELDTETKQVKMITVHYRTDYGGFWCVDRDYDPTNGNTAAGYKFDSNTGLLEFTLRGGEPIGEGDISLKPTENRQKDIEAIIANLAKNNTKDKFSNCLNRQLFLDILHNINLSACTALEFTTDLSPQGVIKRNQAIIKFPSLKQEMKKCAKKAGDKSISEILKSISRDTIIEQPENIVLNIDIILNYLESEDFHQTELPQFIINTLIKILQDSEHIINNLSEAQINGMENSHGSI